MRLMNPTQTQLQVNAPGKVAPFKLGRGADVGPEWRSEHYSPSLQRYPAVPVRIRSPARFAPALAMARAHTRLGAQLRVGGIRWLKLIADRIRVLP